MNGNTAWVKILWLWLCQKKGKASTWNSEGKLASAIAVSLDISPNACFISIAFLSTKQYCQALEAASGKFKSILVGRVIRQRAPQRNVLSTYPQQASSMKEDISWLCFLSFVTGYLSKRKNSSRKGIVLPSTPSFLIYFSSFFTHILQKIHTFFCSTQAHQDYWKGRQRGYPLSEKVTALYVIQREELNLNLIPHGGKS